MGSRLAFEGRIHRKYDLVDAPIRDTADELVDREILRPYPF